MLYRNTTKYNRIQKERKWVGGGYSYGFYRRNVKMAFGQNIVIWIKYSDHSSNIDTDTHLINMQKEFIHIFILCIAHYTLSSICVVGVRTPPGNYNDIILVSFLHSSRYVIPSQEIQGYRKKWTGFETAIT